MADQARYGGMNQQPICIPSVLGPMLMCIFFPPLYVFMHELRKSPPFQNIFNLFTSLILTSLFYFPGLIHGMSLMRTEGTWSDNYSGLV
jgi:uncharacterized membrane protein YqaE (UPF0057 family)